MTFFRDFWLKKQLIFEFGLRDFKSSYVGSLFGFVWAFIEPLAYVSLLYFFIGRLAKYQPSVANNYLSWLVLGMMAWTFFSTTLSSGVRVYKKYSFLLKRQGFNLALLPLITIISALCVHTIFLVLTLAVLVASDVSLQWIWLQYFYYTMCTCILLMGLIWLTASLAVFVKDVEHVVALSIQLGFWVSPIFWSIDAFPERYHFLLKLNPIFYIINGYRDTFLFGKPFWENSFELMQFWIVTGLVLLLGRITYNKLRPAFGDVLHG